MEIFLEGPLQAGLADAVIHLVVQVLVFLPVIGVHGTGGAQDVGGVGGIVLPLGGGGGIQTGDIQLQNGVEDVVGHVLHEDVAAQIRDVRAEHQLIAQADDGPGIGVGPVFGDLVQLPQGLHEPGCGNIRVDAQLPEVILEIALPVGGLLRQGILIGAALGDGEILDVVHAQLVRHADQPQQMLVGLVGVGQNEIVEHQVIAGPVAHHHVAVAVQKLAPGGLDGVIGGVGIGVRHDVAASFKLYRVHPHAEQAQDDGKYQQHGHGSESGYSFHALPPVVPMCLSRAYTAPAARVLMMAVSTKTGQRAR